jgi:hypothetical protein
MSEFTGITWRFETKPKKKNVTIVRLLISIARNFVGKNKQVNILYITYLKLHIVNKKIRIGQNRPG